MGMHGLHAVDKSQNRNNYSPRTVDNLVDGVDRYASIHPFEAGMNMQEHTKGRSGRRLAPAQIVNKGPRPSAMGDSFSSVSPFRVLFSLFRKRKKFEALLFLFFPV